jgi:hypothetical protein
VKKKIILAVVGVLALIGVLGYLLVAFQIRTENRAAGYRLTVKPVKLALFLVKNGYYRGEGLIKSIKVILTNDEQPYLKVRSSKGEAPFQSARVNKDKKGLTAVAHYTKTVNVAVRLSFFRNPSC